MACASVCFLKSGKAPEHLAKNDDAWTCAVEIAGITALLERVKVEFAA